MSSLPSTADEFSIETRDAMPAHFLIKIESFSLLSKHGIKQFETHEFVAGDYKWKLVIHDDEDHISVHLAVAETSSLPVGWVVNSMFNILLYNQIMDNYLCFRSKARRFHAAKPQWGLSKVISKKILEDPSNGYLVDDNCIFGAEVHFIKNQHVTHHFLLKDDAVYKRDWKITGFTKLNDVWTSEAFRAKDFTWKLQVYPNGDSRATGRNVSIFLSCVDFASAKKVKTHYCVRIKNQLDKEDLAQNLSYWFTSSSNCGYGWSEFATLVEIRDPEKGYVVEDRCVVEIELSVQAVSCDAA